MCERFRPAAVLAGTWAVLVLANAFAAHVPRLDYVFNFFWPPVGTFTPGGFAAAQSRNLACLAALAAFDAACWGAGVVALRLLGTRALPGGALGAGCRIAAGASLAGLASLGLSLTGIAYAGVFAAMGIAGASCLLARGVRPGRLSPGAFLRSFPPLPALLAVLGAASALAGALAPEAVEDSLRFFLEVPRTVLLRHRLVPQEAFPLAWTPLLSGMTHLPLYALAGGAGAVKLMSWQAYVFIAILVAGAARSLGPLGTRIAPWAAAAWLCMFGVHLLASTAMVEMEMAALVTLAATIQFRHNRPLLAGLLWGCAAGFKYQAVIFIVPAALAETLRSPRRALGLVACAAVPFAPWVVRNTLGAGFPFAPFGPVGGICGASPPDFFFLARKWSLERTVQGALAAPWTRVVRIGAWDSLLSPLALAVLPLAFTRATPLPARLFLSLSLGVWAWTAGFAGRYLLPVLPFVLIEACSGAGLPGRLSGTGLPWRIALAAAVGYEFAISVGMAYLVANPVPVALGRETREAYLERMLFPRPVAWGTGLSLRALFSPDTHYYLAGAAQGYYWPGLPLLDCEYMPSRMAAIAGASNGPGRVAVAFRQRGVSYIVHHETTALLGDLGPGRGGWDRRSRAVWRRFVEGRLALRFHLKEGEGAYALYSILKSPRPAGSGGASGSLGEAP